MIESTTPLSASSGPIRSVRLLLISYEYPPLGGGLGKAVRETGLEFARRGCDVTVLTSRFGDQPRITHEGPLRLIRIPVARRHLNYASRLEVLSFAASGLFSARWILDAHRPELILAYLTIPSGLVGVRLASVFDVPLYTLLRGTDVPGHRELPGWIHWMASPATRYVWKRSRRIISNSHANARQAEDAVRGLSVDVVHNGVDVDRYAPVAVPLSTDAPLRVLYAGRIVRVKRLELLINAWAEVRNRSTRRMELVLAGFGPERPRLEALAKRLGVENSVRFPGRLDEEEMIRVYGESSVFVSLSRDEGLPNAVLEAMSCGLPLVLSDIAPHRECVGDSNAAVFCDGDNVESVAGALLRVLDGGACRAEMGRSARGWILDHSSWSRTAEQTIALFPGALKRRISEISSGF